MSFQDFLTLRAGASAHRSLETHGLTPQSIGALAGAAGGPKWLILSALDRYLFDEWLPRSAQPIELVGSSIGAWRFAAACHPSDPGGAIDTLEQGYLAQRYSANPDRNEITGTVRSIFEHFFNNDVLDGVLTHPRFRLHAVTVRSRLLVASEHRALLATGSALGALSNVASRRALNAFFERVVFSRTQGRVCWAADGLRTRTVALTAANAHDAIFASGNIPLMMRGVVDPAGAPSGIYRDGGIADYHIDQPLVADDAAAPLVLMPHFDVRLVPGWFDKALPWRRPRFAANTLMIGPGPALRAKLVDGRVPDRKDFRRFAGDDAARLAAWQQAIDAGRWMRDAFAEFAETDDPARFVTPL